jgi:[FeFe] hydrogenase H-cluster maturation GTPase HydF
MKKAKDARPHIGIFGRRNYGKSTLINTLTGQNVAIVSDVPGTTTDPVKKSVEIPGIGACVIIDTAGMDDVGELGEKRVQKTFDVLPIIDLAILVISNNIFESIEENFLKKCQQEDLPYIIVHNKSDIQPLSNELKKELEKDWNTRVVEHSVSAPAIDKIVEAMLQYMPESAYMTRSLVGDLINYGDTVLLITPIDIEAPEGRLILPQVQVIRDILDHDGIAVVCKEREVDAYIRKMEPKPVLAITDSQVFLKADAAIPKHIKLTSFSILLARQKGDFENYIKGTPYISQLKDGDRVLLLEGCTHQVSCDDIGRVKIPRWITQFTGKKLEFEIVSGLDKIPRDIHEYALIIHCGGCVLTRRQVIARLRPAVKAGIPVTNYGMAIAYVHGIFNRAIEPFVQQQLDDLI